MREHQKRAATKVTVESATKVTNINSADVKIGAVNIHRPYIM